MIAEVVSVGTELLIGEIVDTNAAAVAQRLAAAGLDAHYRVTVGDNLERIVAVLATACERADVVVVTGGIGPTGDDITKDALCVMAGLTLARDDAHAVHIHDVVMARRGIVLDTVLQMADVPVGSDPLPNDVGLALGVALKHRDTWLFVLPGVPSEMIAMLDTHVVPRLVALTGGEVVHSEVVRTVGLGESQVAACLGPLFASTNPSIAFRIDGDQVLVRITAKAASQADGEVLVAGLRGQVETLLADALA
ncbi:MAG: molybdopterin-binding protein [Nocardioides sp.]